MILGLLVGGCLAALANPAAADLWGPYVEFGGHRRYAHARTYVDLPRQAAPDLYHVPRYRYGWFGAHAHPDPVWHRNANDPSFRFGGR